MSDKQQWDSSIPIISLWMPWANWVMLGWKTIETRRHRRFAGLAGKTIGIHATQRWDDFAIQEATPFMCAEQIAVSRRFLRVGGAILGTVYVEKFRELEWEDSGAAMIQCAAKRYGLFLGARRIIEAIPAKGKQGIWYREESHV